MNDTYRSQFRLPFDLADKLREAAEASGRSMNAEIVARLEQSFQGSIGNQLDIGALASKLAEHLVKEGLQLAVVDTATPMQLNVRATFRQPGDSAQIEQKAGRIQRKAQPTPEALATMAGALHDMGKKNEAVQERLSRRQRKK